MIPVSVVGVFCEDIREEKSGQDTIIGTLPDNVNMPNVPNIFSRLGLYGRIHLDANAPIPKNIVPRLVAPDGNEVGLPNWQQGIVDQAFVDAKANGFPLVGLILRVAFMNVPVPKTGLFTFKVTIDDTEYIGANLRIVTGPSTAPVQPVSQSGTGVQSL